MSRLPNTPRRRDLPVSIVPVGETSWSRCNTVSGQGGPAYRTSVDQDRLILIRSGAGAPELQRWAQCLPIFAHPPRPDKYQNGVVKHPHLFSPLPPSLNDGRSGVSLTNPLTLPPVLTAVPRLLPLLPGQHFRFCRVRGTRHGYQR